MTVVANLIENPRAFVIAFAVVFSLLSSPARSSETTIKSENARLIVITDIGTEPDDLQSMVRLLTYANDIDIDIEGLIASTSKHRPKQVNPDFIRRRIEAYEEAPPNLRIHDPRHPDPESLLQVVRASDPAYGTEGVGKGNHAEASQLIIDDVHKSLIGKANTLYYQFFATG